MVTKVVLAASVKTINDEAFNGWENLKEVIIPSNSQLSKIGKNAFAGTGLVDFSAPQQLREIGEGAFYQCRSLIHAKLNEGLEALGTNVPNKQCHGVFEESGLQGIRLPTTLKKISSSAFRACASLSSVELPDRLETIGPNAFENSGLQGI